MKKILFVCYGNICRSTMAEMIMKYLVKSKGLEKDFYIDSAGTSNEEKGSSIYPNTRQVLKKNNVPCGEHFARQMTMNDYDGFDYIICMEERNVRDLMYIIGEDIDSKVCRLLDFTDSPRDIPDPWYHRDFDKTYKEILHGCESALAQITNDKK